MSGYEMLVSMREELRDEVEMLDLSCTSMGEWVPFAVSERALRAREHLLDGVLRGCWELDDRIDEII